MVKLIYIVDHFVKRFTRAQAPLILPWYFRVVEFEIIEDERLLFSRLLFPREVFQEFFSYFGTCRLYLVQHTLMLVCAEVLR